MRCSFEKLCSYLDNRLDGTRKYEVIAHLHECEICLEAVSLMCQERGLKDQSIALPAGKGAGQWQHREAERMKRVGNLPRDR